MFGKSKRQIKDVTFVQPLKGEVYFYTPIAYATNLQNSKEREGKQVFIDSDLALAGKLKLIFEREKMTWFENQRGEINNTIKRRTLVCTVLLPSSFGGESGFLVR